MNRSRQFIHCQHKVRGYTSAIKLVRVELLNTLNQWQASGFSSVVRFPGTYGINVSR